MDLGLRYIIASKNDFFYKALQIKQNRMRFCKTLDANLVSRMNSVRPQTMSDIERIWYAEYNESRERHYYGG